MVRSKRVILIDGVGLHRVPRGRERENERNRKRDREGATKREIGRRGSTTRWRANPGTRGRVVLGMVESTRGDGCRRVVGPTRTIVTKGLLPSRHRLSLSSLLPPAFAALSLSHSHWLVLFLLLALALVFYPRTLSFCLSSRRAVARSLARGLARFTHATSREIRKFAMIHSR